MTLTALERYGNHDFTCATETSLDPDISCTCGFLEALKAQSIKEITQSDRDAATIVWTRIYGKTRVEEFITKAKNDWLAEHFMQHRLASSPVAEPVGGGK